MPSPSNHNEDIFNPSDDVFASNTFGDTPNNMDEKKYDVTIALERKKKRYIIIFTIVIGMIAFYSVRTALNDHELSLSINVLIIAVVCGFMCIPLRNRLKFLNQYQGKQYITLSKDYISIPYFMFPDIVQKRYNYKFETLNATYNIADITYVRHFTKPRKFPSTQIRFINGDFVSVFQQTLGDQFHDFQNELDKTVPATARQHDLKKYAEVIGRDIVTYQKFRFFVFIALSVFFFLTALTQYLNKKHIRLPFPNDTREAITSRSSLANEGDISDAVSWGTSSNPAFLSEAQPESFATTTWPSGNLRSSEPMVNNVIDGIGSYYHDNGALYGKIPYLHGEKHGRFDLFFEDGRPDQSLSYKHGRAHGVLTWHETKQSWVYVNGDAVKEIPYQPPLSSPENPLTSDK